MCLPTLPQVYLSEIDEKRFGYRSAKASQVTVDSFPLIVDFCEKQRVEFLVARCPTTALSAAQAMEKANFSLMDTLIYYRFRFSKAPIPNDTSSNLIRPVRDSEAGAVKMVAEKAFAGYFGHYHADERLAPEHIEAVYPDWAFRSCVSKEMADEVFVAELDGSLVGFATLKMPLPQEGEGVLFGIAPEVQKRGIYRSFMIRGLEWCRSQNAESMVVSTQITNIAVQKVWSRLGFEPSHSYYTFHKWFI